MRDDEADAREFLLDLEDLRKVYGVLQSAGTRDMQHHDRAELVHAAQLLFGEKVEDADLALRDIGGRKIQIRLEAQEVPFAELLLDLVSALGRVAEIERRETDLSGTVADIVVVGRRRVAAGKDQRRAVLSREQQAVRLLQVLNAVVLRDQTRPCDGALFLTGRGRRFAAQAVEPYVAVYVQKRLREKIAQLFVIDPAVVFRYFKKCHDKFLSV